MSATTMIVLHTHLVREGVARHQVIDTAIARGWLEHAEDGPIAFGLTGARYDITDLGRQAATYFKGDLS